MVKVEHHVPVPGSVFDRITCRTVGQYSRNSRSPQVSAAASERRTSQSLSTETKATSTRARQEARSADSLPLPLPSKGLEVDAVAFTAARIPAVRGRACL